MEQEVYGKEVAEIICIKTDWQDALDIRDDGVYVKDGYLANDPGEQAFTWTPACEMDWCGAPDPLTAPSLPIPFTANDLAAFILDGAGHGIQGRYGRIEHGPDEDELRNLGMRGNKVRKVLREAYNLAQRAQFSVGTDNIEEQQRAADLRSAYADSREEAMSREKVMERVIVGKHADGSAEYGDFIPREEYLRRLARVNEAVAEKKEEAQSANAESDSNHAAWRNAMVNQLLKPLSTQAAAAQVVDGAEEIEPVSPKFEQWRLLWRAVSFDENRVKTAMNELEHFTPTGISEVVIRDEKRTSLREELTRIAGRKDWLALQMGVDMQLAADRRYTMEEMNESRHPLDVDDVVKRVTEMALANQEIDALIEKCPRPATEALADQTDTVEQAPLPPDKSTRKPRVTWRDLAWDYVVETYSSRPFASVHTFYATLVNKVGNEMTPFTLHDRELFLMDIGQSVAEKTIANNMKEIKKAAICRKSNP